MNEIDKLIRTLGGDTAVAKAIKSDPARVLKWRRRNRIPPWYVDEVAKLAKGHADYATAEWLMNVNRKMAKRGRK